MKVALVYGGFSSERKASEENAVYIEKALREKGYETCMIPYEKGLIKILRQERADIVYVCVQGKGHGDGTIQAILEQEGIPFTGSDAHAAALINDKIWSKLLFDRVGIPTPRWEMLTRQDYEKGLFHAERFGYPFVAKAPSEGGSFGIELIRGKEELGKIEEVFTYESPILIEEFIPGTFYTIGVLKQDGKIVTLPCVQGVELIEDQKKVDPDSLTVFTGGYTVADALLSEALLEEMDEIARKVFTVTGARDLARIDFMVKKDDMKPYVLEINAVPGLKPRSLFPGEAVRAGIEYEDLIEGILLEAWNRTRKEEN